MAVRHSLCVVPVLLLIGGGGGRRAGGGWVATATALTAVCGTWFGASDWVYADVYRQEARRLYQQFSREGQTLWHVGHWGWQWYADQAGMQQYDLRTSQPVAGDRIVVPRLVDKQPLAARHQRQLKLVGQSDVAAPPVTWVRMMAIGPRGGYGYYAFRIETLPWTFSTGPLEHFDVFEWHGPAEEGSSRLDDGRSNGFRATR
jgi:hypothetical protein